MQPDKAAPIRMVSDFMTADPICGAMTDSVREVADLLLEADIRHLPIVEDGRLVAMVSDRDVRTVTGFYLNARPDRTAGKLPCVADFCDSEIITVSPEDDIVDVINLMLDHKIGALPVVDSGDQRLVGIVSYIDVLREVRDALS